MRGISWQRSAEAEEGVPALTIPNIQENLDLRKLTFLRGLSARHFEKARVRAGHTILVGSNGNKERVGDCLYFRDDTPFVFASFLMGVRPHEDGNLDSRFVHYWLKSPVFRDGIHSGLIGSTSLSNLRVTALRDMRVAAPSLKEQRKIASVLASYDGLIQNNTRRIHILEKTAQAIYREWFVEFRHPGHPSTDLVESDLGLIPEGWEVQTLAESAEIVMGQSPKSDFYNDEGLGLPFHQGVTNFGAHFPRHKHYSTAGDRTAHADDILFSVRAPVGRINVADTNLILGRGLCAIRPATHRRFMLFQLKWRFLEEDTIGSGAIFNSVRRSDMERLLVLAPPSEIAGAYEALVDPMWALLRTLTLATENLRATRDFLLPRLMSGEVDVSDLDIDTSGLVA